MARHRRLRDSIIAFSVRRRSARFRLTALYCGLFFPAGVVLVVITYVLIVVVRHPVDQAVLRQVLRASRHLATSTHGGSVTGGSVTGGSVPPAPGASTSRTVGEVTVTLPGHIVLVGRDLVVGSCIVLVAMIGLSVLLGWFAAGRILRPLRVMTTTARRISEHNLHERLALGGPDDELKNLGDTIDELLAHLETAFDAQRRFVANASHELRTPVMLSQTILQVALANPDISLDSLRAACEEAVDAGKDQAQLIEALLTLARSQRGLDLREPVDLATVVNDVLDALGASATSRGLQVTAALDPAVVPGDAVLLQRLVSNLVDNAIRYNATGGRVEVALVAGTSEVNLTVANTGLLVPGDDASRLLEPFQRAVPGRTASPNGLGLGLSIVADVARAHDASLEVLPLPDGGLTVTVRFPTDPI